jgi:hypothetical protein
VAVGDRACSLLSARPEKAEHRKGLNSNGSTNAKSALPKPDIAD